MKNTFSVSNYNVFIAFATALMTVVIFILPIPLLLFQGTTGPGNGFSHTCFANCINDV
jgi:hypothetical protein